jgi:hypothetical protein
MADVNGDRKADLVTFERGATSAYVSLSNGDSFAAPADWSQDFCNSSETCTAADVDGDGKADAIALHEGVLGGIDVALSTGAAFAPATSWMDQLCTDGQVCLFGDVDGDGRADAVVFLHGASTEVWVALSTGHSFGTPSKWSNLFCQSEETCALGDVDGDGMADVVAFSRIGGAWVWTALSTGSSFGQANSAEKGFCPSGQTCAVGDVDGDGRLDAVAFTLGTTDSVDLALSSRTDFDPYDISAEPFCRPGETCEVADVDGDGRADLIAIAPGSSGNVSVATALGGPDF